jgi:serine/threonine-protein kinase ATR
MARHPSTLSRANTDGASMKGSRTNGVHTNGEAPPPSTLAAQIVHNQTTTKATQQSGEKATFAGLLHEILHNPSATPETDIGVNVQLISVVVEAGLSILTRDDPFAQLDVLLPQAADSLAVVEATIVRQSDVLFAHISEDGPPLIVWLLTRLLPLCSRPKCSSLAIAKLINSAINAVGKSKLWRSAAVIQELVRDCVNDTLNALETQSTLAGNLSVALPPARWISKIWPESQNAIALPHDCQTRVSDSGSASLLVLSLVDIDCAAPRWLDDTHLRLQRLVVQLRSTLRTPGLWDSLVTRLLGSLKHAPLLQLSRSLLENASQTKLSREVQLAIAEALAKLSTQDSSAVQFLLPAVTELGESEKCESLERELHLVIATCFIHFHLANDDMPGPLQATASALTSGELMDDDALSAMCQNLVNADVTVPALDAPRKRRKLVDGGADNREQRLQARLSKLLTGATTSDLSTLPKTASSSYAKLDGQKQETVWYAIAELAALGYDRTLLLQTVSQLVDSPELQKSKRLRVISMGTVQACLEQMTESSLLDLGNSRLGQYCLRSLQSSLRELRLAAGRCLPAFLRKELSSTLLSRNRQIAFQCLRTLSDRNIASELETLIAAWGSVAVVSEDKELNLALLQLVDLLGHTNPLVCGLAFSEIDNVAQTKGVPALKLFTPYLSSIALSVVLEIHSRPQKIQQLCAILGLDVNQFLTMTDGYTVPSLVLHRKKDILQRLATARGENVTVHHVCRQPRSNLAAILVLLLSQSSTNVEEATWQCLTEAAPDFHKTDLDTTVQSDSTYLACELLKFIGEQPEERKSRAYQAFNVFANLAERRSGQTKAHNKLSKTLSSFFGTHVLGIMTNFSVVLASSQDVHRTHDKIRCIWGISEMVLMARDEVTMALPQIRACLQYAIEQPDLLETAWAAWLLLLPNLESEDIALIADQTFALIINYWDVLSPESQQLTHTRIAEMIKNHNTTINDIVMLLPSLSHIPLLSKFGTEIERLQSLESPEGRLKAFAKRLKGESSIVVTQALCELLPFLELHQGLVHDAAISEQPEQWLPDLVRALLDATTTMANVNDEVADLCGKCLGLIGCLDPDRVDASKLTKPMMVMSNFDKADEIVEWVVVLLENVLVKAFKHVSNARAQGFLAYVMQELLRFCGFNDTTALRPRATQATTVTQRWLDMPEHVRTTLTPFLTSRYITNVSNVKPDRSYPGFSREENHSGWLRGLAFDLMCGKACGDNAKLVFPLLARIIRGHDLSIAAYLLPYAMTNVVLGGTAKETKGIHDEILAVLKAQSTNTTEMETIRLCSETVFTVLDYMCVWLREKKKAVADTRSNAYRTGQSPTDFDEIQAQGQIETLESFLATIPADLLATRAMECGTYARALFNWEQYIRQSRPLIPLGSGDSVSDQMNDRLIDIYSQIDEPDGLEGISAHLTILSDEQQATLHARSGRWTAAQAWYELQLAERPNDEELQTSLLQCLRETGRYAPLLRYADSFLAIGPSIGQRDSSLANLLPSAIEACYMTGDSASLSRQLRITPESMADDFNVSIGHAIEANNLTDSDRLMQYVNSMRRTITTGMSVASGSSLHGCHTELLRLHILSEIEALNHGPDDTPKTMVLHFERFEKRLDAVGSYISDKQSILGIRRAMFKCHELYTEPQMGALWLTTARLSRKAGNTEAAYNAVLQAYECGDKAAKLEEARLLWRDGHGRQAISALEGAIKSEVFNEETESMDLDSITTRSAAPEGQKQNMLLAKAHLLLAKWLDASGQTQTKDMTAKYQYAAKTFQRWEKGHYYLGKHYNKLLEVEKLQPKSKQSSQLLCGELPRLVVENLLRSIPFGNKYWHETIPKILTLWLDLGLGTQKRDKNEGQDVFDKRARALTMCNKQVRKYFDRVPPYIFYQALPQMLSRISHPHPEVWKELSQVITKIASTYPSQALWSLLAVSKATDRLRHDRAVEVINKLRDPKLKSKTDSNAIDLRMMIASGQRLSDGLLQASEAPVEARQSHASLSRDLNFNHKLAPCALVVPLETTLTASMPAGADSARIRSYAHKAFAHDKITIQSFEDSVLVLSSLQRPKKVTVKGSDGKTYGLLCKPKDDLRKDQRLMEFNGVINRALKRDAEASKRRLYIKTYAVTPLSEESGILEWVEGIKPIRDILLQIYMRKGIRPNYAQIRNDLNEACKKSPVDGGKAFLDKVQTQFPACLHEWFTEVYPEPETWFNARLRYARTAAVMSMTGHVLGLGDRHGENILLQESTGGVFHVDFNCLFDKGSTFEKPEVVPFRLTHNMVDAMGPYGYEGPFRRSSELTLGLLRQNKDTLNTILETFLYDPTTDFVGKKKRHTEGVPETPQEILDSVGGKLKGYYKKEMVPLSVEGYADALIRDAVDPWNLCQMYIGWCAFL